MTFKLPIFQELCKIISAATNSRRLRKCVRERDRGNYYADLGDFAAAQNCFSRAAHGALLLRRASSTHHSELSSIFVSYGNNLSQTGKHKLALTWLRLAADEVLKVGPMDQYEMWLNETAVRERCICFLSLMTLLFKTSYLETKRLVRDGCATDKVPDVIPSTLAAQLEEARSIFERASIEVVQYGNLFPTSHVHVCRMFMMLGERECLLGRHKLADKYLEKAAHAATCARDESFGMPDPEMEIAIAESFRCYGDNLVELGRGIEAIQWLRRASLEAERCNDPYVRCNAHRSLGTARFQRREYAECIGDFEVAAHQVFAALSRNSDNSAISNLMELYHGVFEFGWRAAEKLWLETGEDKWLIKGLAFADGARCVAIREALRKHNGGTRKEDIRDTWNPSGNFDMFLDDGGSETERYQRSAIRESAPVDERGESSETEIELPEESTQKNEYCRLIDYNDLAKLLPDEHTIVVEFCFDNDDLLIIPVRRQARSTIEHDIERNLNELRRRGVGLGTIANLREIAFKNIEQRLTRVCKIKSGFLCLRGVKQKLVDIVGYNAERVDAIKEQVRDSSSQRQELRLKDRLDLSMSFVYEEIGGLLDVERLLNLIEPNPENRRQLHLVLVPAGPLLELPIHAAGSEGRRLYQQVASVRYGLSMRTLELQQRIEDGQAKVGKDNRVLRGVAFANPDRMKVFDGNGKLVIDKEGRQREKLLRGVIDEARMLAETCVRDGNSEWWIHGESGPAKIRATRANSRNRHASGNIWWVMGHGGPDQDEIGGRTVIEPAAKLCDGPLSMTRMMREGYDFSGVQLLNFSCCLLGRVEQMGTAGEVKAYSAILALLGARRVCSAMWPLVDDAAVMFSTCWIKAIKLHVFGDKQPGPNAFALAFRQAVDEFRAVDNGRYDHEFFWAPYTLYGLG